MVVRILLLLVFAGQVFAHTDLDEQITTVTRRIQQDPANPQLYLRRGELLHQIGKTDRALKDCSFAEKLKPDLPEAILCRGAALLASKNAASAKKEFDSFLNVFPDHLPARHRRAQALFELREFDAAMKDLRLILDRKASPEIYLFASKVLLVAYPEDPTQVLQLLNEGIEKLGPIPALQKLEMDLRNHEIPKD